AATQVHVLAVELVVAGVDVVADAALEEHLFPADRQREVDRNRRRDDAVLGPDAAQGRERRAGMRHVGVMGHIDVRLDRNAIEVVGAGMIAARRRHRDSKRRYKDCAHSCPPLKKARTAPPRYDTVKPTCPPAPVLPRPSCPPYHMSGRFVGFSTSVWDARRHTRRAGAVLIRTTGASRQP